MSTRTALLKGLASLALWGLPLSAKGQEQFKINVKNGETAVVVTSLSATDATAKVKAYFNGRDINFTVNKDTEAIVTDWFGERRCGPGFYRCAVRANVRVVADGGSSTLRIQVFERKREGGMNEKPWKENSNTHGKETSELASALEAFIAGK